MNSNQADDHALVSMRERVRTLRREAGLAERRLWLRLRRRCFPCLGLVVETYGHDLFTPHHHDLVCFDLCQREPA
jgi:very-short-patch-repair endonuclease